MIKSLVSVLAFEAAGTAAFQFTCVFLVSIFIVFCCIPRLHSPIRSLIRPPVIHWVEQGLEWVVFAQNFKRPWLTRLFEQSSHSVSVAFYGSFLPAIIWLGLPELGWHLVVLMTLTLYVGNAMKDLVSAPRPLGLQYGEARLSFLGKGSEEANLNAKEYGLPSSHTMNSLCLNFYTVHYLHEKKLLSDGAALVSYFFVVLWVLWIASSRIYLGLHTPIDIGAGAVAGLTTVTTFISLEPVIDCWVMLPPPTAVSIAALVSLILLRLHPKPLNHTPTFEFSTAFMGVMLGAVLAVSRFPEFYSSPVAVDNIRTKPLWWVVRRLLLGFSLVLASKNVFKKVARTMLPRLYRFFPTALRRLWQPPVHNRCSDEKIEDPLLKGLPHAENGRPWDVEVTARFFAYAGIGYAAFEMAPRLFQLLNW